jgi:hypothetical protein
MLRIRVKRQWRRRQVFGGAAPNAWPIKTNMFPDKE